MNDCKWLSDDFSYVCCCVKHKNCVGDACPYEYPDDAYWNCPCYEKEGEKVIGKVSEPVSFEMILDGLRQKMQFLEIERDFLIEENKRLRNQVNSLMGWELEHAEVKENQAK